MAGGVRSLVDGVGYAVGSPPLPPPDGGFVGLLDFTGLSVGVLAGVVALPGTGAAVFTGYEPTVAITSGVNAQPGTGAATFAGYAPTLVRPINVTPGVGAVVVTGFSPVALVEPGAQTVTFTGHAPAVVRYASCVSADSSRITADSDALSADLESDCPDEALVGGTRKRPLIYVRKEPERQPRRVLHVTASPGTGTAAFIGYAPTGVIAPTPQTLEEEAFMMLAITEFDL